MATPRAMTILFSLCLTASCAMEIEPGSDPELIDIEAKNVDLPPDWQVCVWEHEHYQGARTCWAGLLPGEYQLPSLVGYPVGDNAMSSLALMPGSAVVIYEDMHFKGRSVRISTDDTEPIGLADLGFLPFGDNGASSIILQID